MQGSWRPVSHAYHFIFLFFLVFVEFVYSLHSVAFLIDRSVFIAAALSISPSMCLYHAYIHCFVSSVFVLFYYLLLFLHLFFLICLYLLWFTLFFICSFTLPMQNTVWSLIHYSVSLLNEKEDNFTVYRGPLKTQGVRLNKNFLNPFRLQAFSVWSDYSL